MRRPPAAHVSLGWPEDEALEAPEFSVCGYVWNEYKFSDPEKSPRKLREPMVHLPGGARADVEGHLGSGSAGHVFLMGDGEQSFAVKVVCTDEGDEDRVGFELWSEMREAGMRCARLFVPARMERFEEMLCFGMPVGDCTLAEAVHAGEVRPVAAAEAVTRGLHLLQLSGYAYCDLKSSNVLVLRRGDTAHLVFCDLGSVVRGGGTGLATYPPPDFPSGVNVPATDRCAAWGASMLLLTLLLGHVPRLAYHKSGDRFTEAAARRWRENVTAAVRAAAVKVDGFPAAAAAILACLDDSCSLGETLGLLKRAVHEEEQKS